MPTVVLADDHPLFLAALRAAVERAGIDVAATVTRGDELLRVMETVEADAVLLDLSMPGFDAFECMTQLRERYAALTIIVVSASDDEEDIRRSLDAGAICFVGKATDPDNLAGAIHVLLSDSIHIGNANSHSTVVEPTPGTGPSLTRRELEILRLVSDGRSNGEMARTLWVTEQTVKFHLSNIYRKVGVSNRTAASRWAQQQGLLDDKAS